jgi:hypothetical protein
LEKNSKANVCPSAPSSTTEHFFSFVFFFRSLKYFSFIYLFTTTNNKRALVCMLFSQLSPVETLFEWHACVEFQNQTAEMLSFHAHMLISSFVCVRERIFTFSNIHRWARRSSNLKAIFTHISKCVYELEAELASERESNVQLWSTTNVFFKLLLQIHWRLKYWSFKLQSFNILQLIGKFIDGNWQSNNFLINFPRE